MTCYVFLWCRCSKTVVLDESKAAVILIHPVAAVKSPVVVGFRCHCAELGGVVCVWSLFLLGMSLCSRCDAAAGTKQR